MKKELLLLILLSGVFAVSLPVSASTLININTADKAALMTLTGIGEVKAQAIIDYRAANGPFAAIEDIMSVSGIGTATFNNIKSSITVSGGEATADASAQTSDTQTSTDSISATTSSQSGTPVSSYVPPPEPTVFVDAGGDRTVIVGADTEYIGRAYNKKQEDVALVRFMWNFGDGTTAEGSSVMHHYEYPGRYAVVLTIAQDKITQASRITVTAEPAQIGFTYAADGSVTIENKAGRNLDLSGWIVRSYGRMFTLPKHSIILTGSSMRIAHATLTFFSGLDTELAYPNGVLAAKVNQTLGPDDVPAYTSPQVPIKAETSKTVVTRPARSVAESELLAERIEPVVSSEAPDTAVTSSIQLAAAARSQSGGSIWWLGAVGFAVFLSAGAYAVRRARKNEWDIVE